MLIFFFVTVILFNGVAAQECGAYRFTRSFIPGRSCEDIYTMNEESRDRPGYYWLKANEPTQVYCGMNYTGSSCEDIANNNPETRDNSGFYRINNNQWTYCNMTSGNVPMCGDGEWTRVVSINITAGDTCPSGWFEESNSGATYCRISGGDNDAPGCSSTMFSTNGTSYQRVCGRARGFQKGETLAFHGDSFLGVVSIDTVYADGLLLTYGSPRQHIWTYTAGAFDNRTDGNYSQYFCPCNGGTPPPAFVGTDYYCESGAADISGYSIYYLDDPLWDGSGCINSRCCENRNQPWFSKDLGGATTSDIEARLCSLGEVFRRFVMIVELELYIQ